MGRAKSRPSRGGFFLLPESGSGISRLLKIPCSSYRERISDSGNPIAEAMTLTSSERGGVIGKKADQGLTYYLVLFSPNLNADPQPAHQLP